MSTLRMRRPPAGSRPGALAIPPGATPPRIHVIDYSPDRLEESDPTDPGVLDAYRDRSSVTWIDVQGLGDGSVIRRIGEMFGIHPLALADVVNVPQRPKAEAYDGHRLFVAFEAMLLSRRELRLDQISVIIGGNFLLTFQEEPGDLFDPVRARLRSGAGAIRRAGPDYLAYALIDTLIDGYYPVVESLGERLERLENAIVDRPDRAALSRLYSIRRELLLLRRALWPHREAINTLIRDEDDLIGAQTRVYLRDCYDHAIQLMDMVETYREMAVGLMDIYMSSVSNRMNEVMKVLTVISSLFIPMTLLVGIYGMNFESMPELHSRWGYPAVWVGMFLIAGAMLMFFRRRGWIGGGETAKRDEATLASRRPRDAGSR